jgi:hypothetical protein
MRKSVVMMGMSVLLGISGCGGAEVVKRMPFDNGTVQMMLGVKNISCQPFEVPTGEKYLVLNYKGGQATVECRAYPPLRGYETNHVPTVKITVGKGLDMSEYHVAADSYIEGINRAARSVWCRDPEKIRLQAFDWPSGGLVYASGQVEIQPIEVQKSDSDLAIKYMIATHSKGVIVTLDCAPSAAYAPE